MSLREDIKRPFNQISLAIAVLGVILAFYFYYFPRNDRRIAWIVDGPALIYDSKTPTSKLRLVDSNNEVVKGDTYVVNYTVWNNGSVPIEPEDIRRPVRLVLAEAERILDFKIVKASDFETGGFSLVGSNFTNFVELHWEHLDPGKAVKAQIIFTQSSQPKPMISYEIVGVSKLVYGRTQKDWSNFTGGMVTFGYLSFFGFGIMANGMKAKTPKKWLNRTYIGIGLLLISGGAILIWKITNDSILMPIPPI